MEEKARRKGRRVSYSLRAAIKAMVQQFYCALGPPLARPFLGEGRGRARASARP
jgi:hypothetical protein